MSTYMDLLSCQLHRLERCVWSDFWHQIFVVQILGRFLHDSLFKYLLNDMDGVRILFDLIKESFELELYLALVLFLFLMFLFAVFFFSHS